MWQGPIVAVACAAASLLENKNLDVDLVMLIEGEEESGSAGFQKAVKEHRVIPSSICAVLWLRADCVI